jgi:hypothetical protein
VLERAWLARALARDSCGGAVSLHRGTGRAVLNASSRPGSWPVVQLSSSGDAPSTAEVSPATRIPKEKLSILALDDLRDFQTCQRATQIQGLPHRLLRSDRRLAQQDALLLAERKNFQNDIRRNEWADGESGSPSNDHPARTCEARPSAEPSLAQTSPHVH